MAGPSAALRDLARELAPDEAVFVTTAKLIEATGDSTDEVRQLRNRLRHMISHASITFVQDPEGRGVWVYRRGSGLLLGGSSPALGAAKEDEIRSRPIDPDPEREEPEPDDGQQNGLQDLVVALEYELSHVEAAFGEIVNEPFPQFPGPAAGRLQFEAWSAEHDRRTHRLVELMERRAALLKQLRELVRR
jgi:hypothetical protein